MRSSPRSMLEVARNRLALDIHGRPETAPVISSIALWRRTAAVRGPRVVVVKLLSSGPKVQAFHSTRLHAPTKQALTWYARRWAIEAALLVLASVLTSSLESALVRHWRRERADIWQTSSPSGALNPPLQSPGRGNMRAEKQA